jgi:hypothetical protein
LSRGPFAGLNLGDHVGDDPAAVAANRRLLAERVGHPVRYMRQVHGTRVVHVRDDAAFAGPHAGDPSGGDPSGGDPSGGQASGGQAAGQAGGPDGVEAPEADALVTDRPGIALAVLVADCVPVLFEGPGVVGVAHAGRTGLADGVVRTTLAALAGLGADPERLRVVVGPSVCAGCYEVPAAMRDEVDAVVPGTAAKTRAGTPGLDLRAGVVGRLRAAGVTDVTVSGRCTAEDAALYSYRRDGRTGRFAGVAWL